MEVGAEGLKLSHFIVQIKLESQKKKKKKDYSLHSKGADQRTHTHTHKARPQDCYSRFWLQQVLATWASGKLRRRRRSRRRSAPPSKPELH